MGRVCICDGSSDVSGFFSQGLARDGCGTAVNKGFSGCAIDLVLSFHSSNHAFTTLAHVVMCLRVLVNH